nr:hypothetical protein [Tanacetum cinerariifolium]
MCEIFCQTVRKKREEKRIEEAQAVKDQNWKFLVCYDDDDDEESSNSLNDNIISELPSYSAVTPTEPVDSLNMGDEHLNTIPATESDEVIKSCVENLVPNPSESEGENGCDVPAGFTTFSNILFDDDYDSDSSDDQSLSDQDDFSDSTDDSTLSDDDSFEDIDYVEASSFDSELVSLEDVKNEILRVKLLNVNLLIAKIESLNDNLTPDRVLKSPSLFPIPVEDSDSFFEKSDTSLSYSDNSLPEFETFSDHTEESNTRVIL